MKLITHIVIVTHGGVAHDGWQPLVVGNVLHQSTDDPSRFLKNFIRGPALPVHFTQLPRDPVVLPNPEGVHAVEACGRAAKRRKVK